MFIALIVSLLLRTSAEPTPAPTPPGIIYQGISVLAGTSKNFPADNVLRSTFWLPNPAIQIMYSPSFGYGLRFVRTFIEDHWYQSHLVEVHLINWTCERGGRICPKDEIVSPRGLAQRAKRFLRASTRILSPLTTLVLTTGLEDTLTFSRWIMYQRELRRVWKGLIVRAPVRNYETAGMAMLEVHATKRSPAARFFSQDGLDLSLPQSRDWVHTEIANVTNGRLPVVTFLWKPRWQDALGSRDYARRVPRFTRDDINYVRGSYAVDSR